MKQVLIFIRPDKYFKTKEALNGNNFGAMSAREVLGRGKARAGFQTADGMEIVAEAENPFMAKKMIEIFCRDEEVDLLIQIVLKINKTGNPGDGKIFVIGVDDGVRIRTEETGINSIM
jgi:nitrogen regulatory protein PII 2